MAQSAIQSKVLLVEGKDEVNFFNALLKHWGIEGVTVQEVGGKDKVPTEIQSFLLTFGGQVKGYAIIRDADRDSGAAFQSVVSLLQKQGEPFPESIGGYGENAARRVGVFIMPGNQDEGMLEDLCLQTVAEHPVMACAERYFSCLGENLVSLAPDQPKQPGQHYFPKNPSKAKAQAFLAGMHGTFASVGVAALNGCWNFDHPALDDLKAFLTGL